MSSDPETGERNRPLRSLSALLLLNIVIGFIATWWALQDGTSGLRGYYYFNRSSELQLAATEVQPTLWFPTDKLIWAELWRNWDPRVTPYKDFSGEYRASWLGWFSVPDSRDSSETVQPGLRATIYPTAEFRGAPIAERIVNGFALDEAWKSMHVPLAPRSIEYLGSLCLETTGAYGFDIESDDGAWLWLDGHSLIADGRSHPTLKHSARFELSKGCHRLRARYFDVGGGSNFRMRWQPPGGALSEIPSSALRHPVTEGASIEIHSSLQKTSLRVDGLDRPVVDGFAVFDLPPGSYPFSLVVESGWAPGELRASWRDAEGQYVEIPRSAFRWAESIAPDFSPFAVTIWIAVTGLGMALSLWLSAGGSRAHAAILFLKAHWYAASAGAITLVGACLRFYDYDRLPVFEYTTDELNNAWLGLNLLKGGGPIGWVWPGIYANAQTRFWLVEDFLIAPFHFHPPPLFPLFAGAAAILGGARDMFEVQLHYYRMPAVIFSSLTVLALIVLGNLLYGRAISLLSGLIYATLPSAVVLGRIAKEETLLAFLAVCAVIAFVCYERSGNRRPLLTAAGLSALSLMTKQSGIFVGAALIVFAAWRWDKRAIVAVSAAALCSVLAYCLYGWWYSWDNFVSYATHYAGYRNTLVSAQTLFTSSALSVIPGNGWLLWLWLSAALTLGRTRDHTVVCLLAYVLVFSVLTPGQFDGSWYRIILYPFLALCGGFALKGIVDAPGLFNVGLFLLTAGFSTIQLVVTEVSSGPPSPFVIRGLTIASVAFVFVCGGLQADRFSHFRRPLLIVAVCTFFLANVYGVLSLDHAFVRPYGLEM